MPLISFKNEAEMADPVVRWMRRNRLAVKSEFSLPWGICDLVGVEFDPIRVQRRLSYGQFKAVGSMVRVAILSRIPELESGRSVTIRRLGKYLNYLPQEKLQHELSILQRDKFVNSTTSGSFRRLNGWAPLHRRIVAVELKLTRVSEAISQALSNLAFATDSYVALPGALALRIAERREDYFHHAGLGLLGIWQSRCTVVIDAQTRSAACDDIIQAHVVERFWRTKGS